MKKIFNRITALLVSLIALLQVLCVPVFAEATGDPMVYLTQKWLNQQYGDVEGFGYVTENGKTGWDTVYGLLRALQYELGITELANSFGPKTTSLYSQNLLYRQDGVTDRKFAILQGALWCKGYCPGYKLYETPDGTVVFDEVFDDQVENAVIELKRDAGFISPDGVVTVNVMKALMSMDSFRLVSSGDTQIRSIQQTLNRKYEAYTGIIACDGVYGRSTNKALIYALQAEEMMPLDVATGNFGNATKLHCPEIPYQSIAKSYTGETYDDARIAAFAELLQFALYVNNHTDISAFQQEMALDVTGVADVSTWMSLLVSSGDKSRTAVAADCATILTEQKAKTLYDNGYRYIGRYLTVGSKAITREEAQIIFDAGLRFFPIYQTSANYLEYFTAEQGVNDAVKAKEAADALGIPDDTVIYFAVDFDTLDYQVTNNIIPYFKRISETLSGYTVGVYGTRNVCTRVSELGYAHYSFVSDMSTGYSGNLGFTMPKNWTFDQFATETLGQGDGMLEIDKNAYSGRDTAVSYLKPVFSDTSEIFSDIPKGSWYKEYVDYAYSYGIFNGTTATTFAPSMTMTRAQFVQVLANVSGVDTQNKNVETAFSDVPSGKWFSPAVKWASDNGIVTGTGNGEFSPDNNITREDMCLMLVRYAKYRSLELKAEKEKVIFADDSKIGSWAKDAVYICQMAEIVGGKGNNTFDPKATGSRSEAATIFTRFHKNYIA